MTEEEELYQPQYDPVVQAIRILARRGRQLREAEERESNATKAGRVVRDAATANAAYEGMTPEERGIAVYQKLVADELHVSEMTELEWAALQSECKRQSEQGRNLIWNIEHHRYLLERIDTVWEKLTESEQQAIVELLQSRRWGTAELAQVKEIVETAQWFGRLTSGQPPR